MSKDQRPKSFLRENIFKWFFFIVIDYLDLRSNSWNTCVTKRKVSYLIEGHFVSLSNLCNFSEFISNILWCLVQVWRYQTLQDKKKIITRVRIVWIIDGGKPEFILIYVIFYTKKLTIMKTKNQQHFKVKIFLANETHVILFFDHSSSKLNPIQLYF